MLEIIYFLFKNTNKHYFTDNSLLHEFQWLILKYLNNAHFND